MSAESQGLFDQAVLGYQAGDVDARELRAAALGHLGASRPLDELGALYAAALLSGDHQAAQALADELVPVRQAKRAAAGVLPAAGG